MKKYEITFPGQVRMVIEAPSMYEARLFATKMSNAVYNSVIGLRIKEVKPE